jgi:hypothetical protein
MIPDLFITWINNLIAALPSPPTVAINDFSKIWDLGDMVNYYFPLSEAASCFLIYLGLVKFKLGIRIIRWIAERV